VASFASDSSFFITSVVIYTPLLLVVSIFNLSHPCVVGSDHTIANLVIVPYLSISDKDTLFKTDTGTNINASP
jgi:hypothetical protein